MEEESTEPGDSNNINSFEIDRVESASKINIADSCGAIVSEEPCGTVHSEVNLNEECMVEGESLSESVVPYEIPNIEEGQQPENESDNIGNNDKLQPCSEALVSDSNTHNEGDQPGFESVISDSSTNILPNIDYYLDNICEIATYTHPLGKYFIGCKWSPDGTCLLSNCVDYTLRLIDLPQDFHSLKEWNKSSKSKFGLNSSLEMKEGGLIYDYAWYPYMSSWNPPSCCFIATSAGSPVHLWDAYTGKIRASYRAYDYADEVHAALSLSFSTSGEDIYCGFQNFVKIFDVSKPGRQCDSFNLKEISSQKGIVSCISENPAVPELFAVGTYNKTIGLYTRSHEFVTLLNGQKSGLTHLQFSNDGSKLFSGARMDNEILCWDIRNLGKVLFSFKRIVATNQRIYFDLTKDNKHLLSGGTDGKVRIWEVENESFSDCEPKYLFVGSIDCVNGVSWHSSYPIIATASGQQHRPEIVNNEDDKFMFCEANKDIENCIKFWWAGPSSGLNHGSEEMSIDSELI